MKEKVYEQVAKAGMNKAIRMTGIICRVFLHQPKMPQKLLRMKGK